MKNEPWKTEPELIEWKDPATGYPCMMKRTGVGVWCGYVGVPIGHPWYGVHGSDIDPYPTVHGGVTFSDHQGDDNRTWWIGFDCSHHWDYIPALGLGDPGGYRDVDYVTAEVVNLALQASESYHPRLHW